MYRGTWIPLFAILFGIFVLGFNAGLITEKHFHHCEALAEKVNEDE